MESPDPKRRRVTYGSWSRLAINILIDVASKHVTSAATYTALRSVCRSWRAAVPATVPAPHRLPPQLPFLLLFTRRPRDPTGPAFSLATNRTIALRHLYDSHQSICVGSCYGWVLLLDHRYNLILRNPFTGDTIRLPTLDGTPALDPRPSGGRAICPYKDKLLFEHHFIVHRAILSSDPSADRRFLVVLFPGTSISRCFTWRSGDNFWTVCRHPSFLPEEIIFYEDRRCIAISPDGECAVFNFSTADGDDGFFTRVPKLPVSGSPFLVESAGNVWLVMVKRTTPEEEAQIAICRLDFSSLPDKVIAVSQCGDLGGRIMFLEQCNSMSVASTHFPGLEGDSVYFTETNWRSLKYWRDTYWRSLKYWRDTYTTTIWECQLKKGIIARRHSFEGESGLHTLWPRLWWVPPNLHKKLGE
uniref:KIB1-4 beta-propeller domain-containing protein n=1 Tax=Ananas comosus var. bracteatus TaxID=296719 RepID=A0A6V7PIU5_ANACO|nr:unnamed protein product [Ananas comosus var. bracteatus]